MLYVKNVPLFERVIRIVLGALLLGGALSWIGPGAAGWVVGALGMMATVSGLFGWCPVCAVAGRRIKS